VIVVSDTSPITNLAAIGQLDLLRQLFQKVIIPESVYHELTAFGGQHPGAIVSSLDWIEIQSTSDQLLVTALRIELDNGEAEAIALAQQISADLVLIDERRGRIVAERFGLRVVGLIGILVEAKRQGLIQQLKPHLDLLIQSGFWISQELYNRVLQAAGE